MKENIMDKQKLYLRVVNKNDIELIFKWSNDSVVRENSFSSEPIKWEEHRKWFIEILENKNVYFFILMKNDSEVGQVRIKIENSYITISYSISSEYRGLGYGKSILILLEKKIYELFRDKYILRAFVKEDNIISRFLFKKLGYIEKKQTEKNICYIKYLK